MSGILLIGGSGPTGPDIATGLSDLGHSVAILHRGTHEVTETEGLEHIHADPHFAESLRAAIAGRTFDTVVATYGRLAAIGDVLAGRCAQLVAVTGAPVYQGWFGPHRLPPRGMRVRSREADAVVAESGAEATDSTPQIEFQRKIRLAEERVLSLAAAGAYSACLVRYPCLYGPRQVTPFEWRIVRRVLDGRAQMIIPENGLAIYTRCFAGNASHTVLLAVSHPDRANGQIFNCGDSEQFSVRQWVEIALEHLGSSMELFSLPDDLAGPGRALNPMWGLSTHGYLDTSKLEKVLGYHDVVPARLALARTIDWYLDHPGPPSAGPGFDYDYEDRAISRYRELVTAVRRDLDFEFPRARHPYAHPRNPGLLSDEHGR